MIHYRFGLKYRTVLNGYPSTTIMPFGKVTKLPADVNIDATTGATSTTFTFDSPIYVQERSRILYSVGI